MGWGVPREGVGVKKFFPPWKPRENVILWDMPEISPGYPRAGVFKKLMQKKFVLTFGPICFPAISSFNLKTLGPLENLHCVPRTKKVDVPHFLGIKSKEGTCAYCVTYRNSLKKAEEKRQPPYKELVQSFMLATLRFSMWVFLCSFGRLGKACNLDTH